MSTLALAFMVGSWSFVLGLTAWCFHRVLRAGRDRAASASGDRPPPRAPGGGGEP